VIELETPALVRTLKGITRKLWWADCFSITAYSSPTKLLAPDQGAYTRFQDAPCSSPAKNLRMKRAPPDPGIPEEATTP
jgi:hypothetical protein